MFLIYIFGIFCQYVDNDDKIFTDLRHLPNTAQCEEGCSFVESSVITPYGLIN